MRTMKRLLASALIVAAAAPAFANTPSLEGTHSDWSVYTRGNGDTKICYAVSQPTTKSPDSVNHGDIYFLVSNWANGAATEQPSLLTGYTLKTTRTPKARVGSTAVSMYGVDNEAFIAETADEEELVARMRAGATMTVEAVSSRGTEVTYNFSLSGVTAALREARSLCG